MIDTDDLIVDVAQELSPNWMRYGDEGDDDPRYDIFHYMKYIRYNPRILRKLYVKVAKLMDYHAENGAVVLTGTTRLMYKADYIFIQQNDGIVRDSFDQSGELRILSNLDQYEYVVNYFDRYLESTLLRF